MGLSDNITLPDGGLATNFLPPFLPIFLAPALLTASHLQKQALRLLYFHKDQQTQVRTF